MKRIEPAGAPGQVIVRVAERHGDAVVLGGEAVLAVDAGLRVRAASAETLRGPIPATTATVPAERAAAIAVADAAHRSSPEGISASSPVKSIYDPRILGAPGAAGGRLVWDVTVSRDTDKPLRERLFIDARTGAVALRMNTLEAALNRRVCDANSTSSQVPCTSPVRSEGGSAVGVADVNSAYDNAGATYSFYSGLGRDGIDGKGGRIDSTVRYCPSAGQCPFRNAYWNGSQMVFGAGYASADDVVAHELTHGVTQNESGLFYYYQSGAINEALSDIFGEFADLANGLGTDTAAVRWKIGEDFAGGVIRDMKDPTVFGDPDRTGSSRWAVDATGEDSGGVHSNSGVANKAAYLITDGDTFNGQTVRGLGIDKAKRIWYQTALLLRSASDYSDLGLILGQACRSLIGNYGIVEDDCVQVDRAATATEMALPPALAPNRKAPVCSSGSEAPLWSDNFDGPANWVKNPISGSTSWKYASEPGANGPYATSGTNNLWIDDSVAKGDAAIEMPQSVNIAAGAFLHFRHAYGFEQQNAGYNGSGDSGNYDGGMIEFSTDGGANWQDAGSLIQYPTGAGSTWASSGPLIRDGGYGGELTNSSDSPLAGRTAFVGQSYGYIATRLDLSSLAGQSVRFRFRMASDTANDKWGWESADSGKGWYIDDVRIYTCPGSQPPLATPPDTVIDSGPAALVRSKAASFAFHADASGATFECALDSSAWGACQSPSNYAGLGQGQHVFRVRAKVGSSDFDQSPATWTWTVDTLPPNTRIRSGPTMSLSRRPTFSFSSGDPDTAFFQCTFDLGRWSRCSPPWMPATSLTKGLHAFRVRAVDLAGNVDPTPATRLVRILR